LTEKTVVGLPHKTLSKQIKTLEQKINNVGGDPRKFFKNKDVYKSDLIDWEMISVEVFPKNAEVDAEFLCRWWQCHLDPTYLRGLLQATEIKLLQALTKDRDAAAIDFQEIETKISEKLKIRQRHPFQLEKY
jgi:hypothetical protein